MVFLRFLNVKFDPNKHQNAPNCTIKKNYCVVYTLEPPSHVASRHANF